MSDRVVTSPAGQEVIVFDDKDWGEMVGLEQGTKSWTVAVERVAAWRLAFLAVLWRDGPIEDRSGRATGMLWDLALELVDDAPNPTHVVASPTFGPCLERETHGRRTRCIKLVALPAQWLPRVEALARRRTPTSIQARSGAAETGVAPRQAAPVPVLDVLDQVRQKAAQARQDAPGSPPAPNGSHRPTEAVTAPQASPDPALATDVASAVATALLAQVVEVLSKGADGSELARVRRDLDAMAQRLGTQVDYVEKLRRDSRAQADVIVALRQERDGLRARLAQSEANLKAATSQDAQRIIDAEVRRQLDRMMRQAPTHRADIDADLDKLAAVAR